jgi:hypothetical protein
MSGVDSPLTAVANRTIGLALTAAGNNKNGPVMVVNSSNGATSAFGTGIVYNANSIAATGFGIDFNSLGSSVAPIRSANNSFPVWRNAAGSANVQVIGLNGSNAVQIAPGGNSVTIGGATTIQSSLDLTTANGAGFGPSQAMFYARGSLGSPTVVSNADRVFSLQGWGYDGGQYLRAGEIDMFVDGTPGSNDMPGRMEFYTTADGSASLALGLTLDNRQNLVMGSAGLGTSATGGFFYAASMAGTPSGTPAMTYTDRVPVALDRTARLLWGNFGGTWVALGGYDLAGAYAGRPTSSGVVMTFVARAKTVISSTVGDHQALALTTATASTVFTIKRRVAGGSTENTAGTITFGVGGRAGTFAFSDTTQLTLNAGDALIITAPATQDATIADLSFSLAAWRQ